MYDPQKGQWTTLDPLSELDFNLSSYVYVGDNPLNFIDPTGMKRVDIDGTDNYYDDETWELTIVGKKTHSDPIFGNLYINYAQNYEKYGKASPYDKEFQGGGTIAAGVVFGPIAAMEAVSAGAVSMVFDSEILAAVSRRSFGRKLLQSMLAKGGINLLGQSAGSMWSGDLKDGTFKLDLVGLVADMISTNGAASVVGGVGEYGLKYENGNISGYSGTNSPVLGTSKFTTGFLFGKYGGQITEFAGANGVSSAMVGMYEGIFKLFNEAFDQGATKFSESTKSQPQTNKK
jgi:hypothetical protein